MSSAASVPGQSSPACDVAGGLLIVSQFTLAADVSGSNRPSFTGAAAPDEGSRLYGYIEAQARLLHPVVHTREFGADMPVHLVNDGPVTMALQMSPPVSHQRFAEALLNQ